MEVDDGEGGGSAVSFRSRLIDKKDGGRKPESRQKGRQKRRRERAREREREREKATNRAIPSQLSQNPLEVIHLMPMNMPQPRDRIVQALRQLLRRETRQRRDHDQLKLHPSDRPRSLHALYPSRCCSSGGGEGPRVSRCEGDGLVVPSAGEGEAEGEDLAVAFGGDSLEDDFDGREGAVRS
jgi:hypothetical protein